MNMKDLENVATELSHDDFIEVTKSSLCTLLSCDPLLSDLPKDILLEEVLSQIAVEHGQAIKVFIFREEEPLLKVIVPQQCTVSDLKKSVARHFELYQNRIGSKVKVSWRYIWKTYNLCNGDIVLEDDNTSIEEYGVSNKTVLKFKKRRNKKQK